MLVLDERRSGHFRWFDIDDEGPENFVTVERHGGRTYCDTLDDLIAKGFRLLDVTLKIRDRDYDGMTDSIVTELPALAEDATEPCRLAFLWAHSDELGIDDEFDRVFAWLAANLMSLEYDPTLPMDVALVLASEPAPERFREHFALPAWHQ